MMYCSNPGCSTAVLLLLFIVPIPSCPVVDAAPKPGWFHRYHHPSYTRNTVYTPGGLPECDCTPLEMCLPAAAVFDNRPPDKEDLELLRMFTCAFDGFKPSLCCEQFAHTKAQRRQRKQKRAYYRHRERPQPDYFTWDTWLFPHWSRAPDDRIYYIEDDYNDDCHHWFGYHRYPRPRPEPSTPTPLPPEVPIIIEEDDPTPTPSTESVSSEAPTPEATPETAVTTTTTTEVPATEAPVETTTSAEDAIAKRRELKKTELVGQTCGTRIENRIVGGEDAKLGDYPWMARLGYQRNNIANTLFRCGGTLISGKFVLTAAHCVTNLPIGLQFMLVRLGELDERSSIDCEEDGDCGDPPQDFTPINIIIHGEYNNPRLSNDIALVELNQPATISGFVSPLCLPFEDNPDNLQNLTGTNAVVAGWGSTNSGFTSGSPTLKWVRLTIIPTEQCIEVYSSRFDIPITDKQICTAGVENMDACEGDSGGPLFRENDDNNRATLIGIVSFGPRKCGTAALPGVYTRVQAYLPWILDSI